SARRVMTDADVRVAHVSAPHDPWGLWVTPHYRPVVQRALAIERPRAIVATGINRRQWDDANTMTAPSRAVTPIGASRYGARRRARPRRGPRAEHLFSPSAAAPTPGAARGRAAHWPAAAVG